MTAHLGIEARAIAEQLGVGTAPQPSVDRVVERLARLVHEAHVAGGEAALAPVLALFAGDPDTPCRTTWRHQAGHSLPGAPADRIECVEVPLDELRDALADAERAIEGTA